MRFRAHQEAAQASTRRLVALFVLVVALLVLAVNAVLLLAYKVSMPFVPLPAYFVATNTGLVLLYVLGGCWFETLRLREGGAHVARMAGGRPVQPSGRGVSDRLERRYANIVQEMAIASRMPAPAAWVLPRDDAINAFAAGWAPEDSVVAVTRGALERLTREELQGVVAHEFSHLFHGDTRLNMRLIGLVWGLQMLFMLGRMLAARDEMRRQPPAAYLFGLALMGVGSLGWAAGRLLQAAVSRQREFLADASAVKYTRVVAGLGGALRKIADQARRHEDGLKAAQAASLMHLMLSLPGARSWWWSTHPPIGERLRRLYGRDPGPLPAELLPPPDDDEPAAVGFAPGAARPAPLSAAGLAEPPEAHRHDALQNPALQGAVEREREALARIDRWHGPRERAAALIALVAGAGDDGAWSAARQATASLGVSAGVLRDLAALRLPARLDVLALLGRRTAAAPAAEARAVLRATRSLTTSRVALLRWLALREALHEPAGTGGRVPLAALSQDALRLSGFMAPLLGAGDIAGWRDRLFAAWPVHAHAWPRDTPYATLRAFVRIDRRLAPMQRPLLWRTWLEATGEPADDAAREALALAALLLDLPRPAIAEQDTGTRPVALQARSL
jgi:Zn-dependent protease with chaperone function